MNSLHKIHIDKILIKDFEDIDDKYYILVINNDITFADYFNIDDYNILFKSKTKKYIKYYIENELKFYIANCNSFLLKMIKSDFNLINIVEFLIETKNKSYNYNKDKIIKQIIIDCKN